MVRSGMKQQSMSTLVVRLDGSVGLCVSGHTTPWRKILSGPPPLVPQKSAQRGSLYTQRNIFITEKIIQKISIKIQNPTHYEQVKVSYTNPSASPCSLRRETLTKRSVTPRRTKVQNLRPSLPFTTPCCPLVEQCIILPQTKAEECGPRAGPFVVLAPNFYRTMTPSNMKSNLLRPYPQPFFIMRQ